MATKDELGMSVAYFMKEHRASLQAMQKAAVALRANRRDEKLIFALTQAALSYAASASILADLKEDRRRERALIRAAIRSPNFCPNCPPDKFGERRALLQEGGSKCHGCGYVLPEARGVAQ